jgi:hypothetical protein
MLWKEDVWDMLSYLGLTNVLGSYSRKVLTHKEKSEICLDNSS